MNAHCPACESERSATYGIANGFTVIGCRACNTMYIRRPDVSEEESYDSYYSQANLVIPPFLESRLDEIVAEFAGNRCNGRLLDVGFGAGGLLRAAKRAGWSAHGVEVSATACEHAAQMGFPVVHATLEAARFPEGHFDVVTAVEVLEHVPDPRNLLREIRRVLRPDGVFWATTPHGRGISARTLGTRWSVVHPPEHLQLFSVRGLRDLLCETGFSQSRIHTHGANPFEIWHSFAAERGSERNEGQFNRVDSSYRMNEYLTGKPTRRVLKNMLNYLLNVSQLGDSLKVRAIA